MGHHAVANKSSGAVFHANGFSVVRYHKDYVYLPNIDERSDTILWKLDKEQYIQDHINRNGDLKRYLRNNGLRV
jgi:RimJ/RimL family protein N-acetyltransferase